MNTISIIPITSSDVLALQNISKQTFSEAFTDANTPEDMELFLAKHFDTKKLLAELQEKDSLFYFAQTAEGLSVGYLKLNMGQAQTEFQVEEALEIERIYVLQAFHGKKVGQFLMQKALQIAKEKGKTYVWLGVWEKNEKALTFYRKNGFEAFSTHIFVVGDDAQTDILMKLYL